MRKVDAGRCFEDRTSANGFIGEEMCSVCVVIRFRRELDLCGSLLSLLLERNHFVSLTWYLQSISE